VTAKEVEPFAGGVRLDLPQAPKGRGGDGQGRDRVSPTDAVFAARMNGEWFGAVRGEAEVASGLWD
jgi:hypothetical protein